jgi:hypothetical protein
MLGHYFYADVIGGWIRSFRLEEGVPVEVREWADLAAAERVITFGIDSVGEIYVGSDLGQVYRIVARR